jgi:hypothetical protein
LSLRWIDRYSESSFTFADRTNYRTRSISLNKEVHKHAEQDEVEGSAYMYTKWVEWSMRQEAGGADRRLRYHDACSSSSLITLSSRFLTRSHPQRRAGDAHVIFRMQSATDSPIVGGSVRDFVSGSIWHGRQWGSILIAKSSGRVPFFERVLSNICLSILVSICQSSSKNRIPNANTSRDSSMAP